MTEDELLAAADGLPVTDVVAGLRFAVLIRSPLLIAHVRRAGGTGGRRVSAGVLVGEPAFAVLVEGGGNEPSLSAFAGAIACSHAFGEELRRAARDRLAADPPAAAVTPAELLSAGARLLG